jgi:hypothetical protein
VEARNDRNTGLTAALQALAAAFAVHAVVLLMLWFQPLHSDTGVTPAFIDVDMVDPAAMEQLLAQQQRTLEELLGQQLDTQVANLIADANAATSSEQTSTQRASEALTAEEARAVEAEIAALEQSEFDRLRLDEKDFGLEELPRTSDGADVETLEDWDEAYDGQVTVSFDLPGRSQRFLPVPGYRCKGGGVVVILIEANAAGEVIAAQPHPDNSEQPECLVSEAVKSALQSRFFRDENAPRRQSGTIRYHFIPQR